MKEKYNIPKVLYLKTCEDVTGYKKNTKQEWISEKIRDEITKEEKIKEECLSKTRKQKVVLQAEYLNAVE
jgi:hypothetical protein